MTDISEKIEVVTNVEEDVAVSMGTAPLAEIVTGNVPPPTEEEIAEAIKENKKSFHERAKEKLEKELKEAKDKSFAEPIIEYLLKRCAEDIGLAEDVCQSHKTWNKCFDFIYESARKSAKGNRQCAVRNDVVFEWAEDYYHKDDKAEEEKKAKEKAEAVKKAKEKAAKAKADGAKKATVKPKKEDVKKEPTPSKPEKPVEKTKKNKKEMDGQMDIFSLMGM